MAEVLWEGKVGRVPEGCVHPHTDLHHQVLPHLSEDLLIPPNPRPFLMGLFPQIPHYFPVWLLPPSGSILLLLQNPDHLGTPAFHDHQIPPPQLLQSSALLDATCRASLLLTPDPHYRLFSLLRLPDSFGSRRDPHPELCVLDQNSYFRRLNFKESSFHPSPHRDAVPSLLYQPLFLDALTL